jgi:hypothetical protein
MPRRTPPAPQPRPRLRKSREEAKRLLDYQISIGEEIARRITGSYLSGGADALEKEISRWSSYNRELLHQLFDTDEVADGYGAVFAAWVSRYESEHEKLRRAHDSLSNRINELKAVAGKLDLYELAPDQSLPEIATFGAATPQSRPKRPQPQPVIHISHSTIGTLNTGEVLGSIRSHVAVAAGPSAEAFREAVQSFAAEIAEDETLSQELRKEVLDSIDYLAEAGSETPDKRRLGVIRGTLTAMPGVLALSAKALEAWDKYGGPIRAHLGL